MCTLAALVRSVPGYPLVVLANRDERLARPATGPRVWPGERFIAPRDEQAGGTWLGLASPGLFVGVTNRSGVPNDPRRESRGALVVEALRHASARALHRALGELSPARFNAFHLLYADAASAFVTWSDGDALRQYEVPAGEHVITERSLGGDDHGRTERVAAELRALAPGAVPKEDALFSILGRHDDADPLAATCVHVPVFGYGTRSSLVLFMREPLAGSRLYWAEGSPCTAPFVERPDLVEELVSASGST